MTCKESCSMLKTLKARLTQGYRTNNVPYAAPQRPDRFAGLPEIASAACPTDCRRCAEACPTDAIVRSGDSVSLDMGKCLFCSKCAAACPAGTITFTGQHDLAAFRRDALIRTKDSGYEYELQPNKQIADLCGRSLKIRQVSAGGCAACELDFNVLNTLAWDMGRFSIQVVASPRHADCILVTGPVSRNMLLALKKTYDAVPKPSFVIACGACAVSGGLYADNPETCGGVEEILKPDLYVPGCPPHPATLLEALIRFLGRKLR